jgi:hypothetical protein
MATGHCSKGNSCTFQMWKEDENKLNLRPRMGSTLVWAKTMSSTQVGKESKQIRKIRCYKTHFAVSKSTTDNDVRLIDIQIYCEIWRFCGVVNVHWKNEVNVVARHM